MLPWQVHGDILCGLHATTGMQEQTHQCQQSVQGYRQCGQIDNGMPARAVRTGFYGFKLHIVINDKGELLDFVITQANEDDRAPLKEGKVLKKIFGSLYADKGYISKDLVEMLFDQGLHLVTGIRNNEKHADGHEGQDPPCEKGLS